MKKILRFFYATMLVFSMSLLLVGCGDPENKIKSIEIDTLDADTVFYVGEDFSSSGIKVQAVYENGDREDVDLSDITINSSDFNSSLAGSYSIYVTFDGTTNSYIVTVVEDALESFDLTLTGVKQSFYQGESFQSTNLSLVAHYDSGATDNISTGFVVSCPTFDSSVPGVYEVTVTFGGLTQKYNVTVVANPVTSLTLDTSNVKKVYYTGEAFSSDNLVVTAHYQNGSSATLNDGDYVLNSNLFVSDVAGIYNIEVSFGGQTETYPVTVKEDVVTSLTINSSNAKTTYYEGDMFSSEGLVVTAHYESGNSVTLSEGDYVCDYSLFVSSTAGTYDIEISYGGESETYSVTVNANPVVSIEVVEVGVVSLKKTFYGNEAFSVNNLIVNATLASGGSRVLGSFDYDIDSSDFVQGTIGRYEIVITYKGTDIKTSYEVEVKADELVSISLDVRGAKKQFYIGEEFTSSGLIVYANYRSGEQVALQENEYEVSFDLYNKNQTGTYQITVSAFSLSTKYSVTVSESTVTETDIELDHSNVKKTFYVGEEFTSSSLVVYVLQSNGGREQLNENEYTVTSNYNKNIAANYTITVSYKTFTKTYDVEVKADTIIIVDVDAANAKIMYYVGEDFSSNGIVVTAVYESGKRETLTQNQYTVNSSAFNNTTPNEYQITVTAGNENGTYYVTVKEDKVEYLFARTDEPNFYVGESFSTTGVVVRATMESGKTVQVSILECEIDSRAFNNLVPGNCEIFVSYGGKTASYMVTVVADEITDITLDTNSTFTIFTLGCDFSYTGLKVYATYASGRNGLLQSGYQVDSSLYNKNVLGTYTITVHVGQIQKTYSVVVKEDAIEYLDIDTSQAKTFFTSIDEFTSEGIVVTAFLESGNQVVLDPSEYEITDMVMEDDNWYYVTVSVIGKDMSEVYYIEIGENVVKSLELDTTLVRKYFIFGQNFFSTGLKVYAVYKNGDKIELSENEYTVVDSGYNNQTAGEYTIYVTYENATGNYKVTVADDREVSIVVDSKTTKTRFYRGEDFTYEGLSVKLIFQSQKSIDLSPFEYSVVCPNYSPNLIQQWTVTVSYGSLESRTYTIRVVEDTVTNIEVDLSEARTKFYNVELFSSEGLKLVLTHESGKIETISEGFTVDSSAYSTLKHDTYTIVVKYGNLSTSYDVVLTTDDVIELRIDTTNMKTTYSLEESLLFDGIVVYSVYDSGLELVCNLYNSDIESVTPDVAGVYTITVWTLDRQACGTFTVEYVEA